MSVIENIFRDIRRNIHHNYKDIDYGPFMPPLNNIVIINNEKFL